MSVIQSSISTEKPVDLDRMRLSVVSELEKFRSRVRTHLVIQGVAMWVLELFAVLVVMFLLDRLFRLSMSSRRALLILAMVGLAIEFVRRVVLPIRLKLSLIGIAAAIDRASLENGSTDSLAARVASIMELPELLKSKSPPSSAMVNSAVERCHSSLASVNLHSHLNHDRYEKAWLVMGGVVIAAMVLIAFDVSSARRWFGRYFLGSNEPWPQNTYLFVKDVQDGKLVVPRAEPFVLRVGVKDSSQVPKSVTIHYREANGEKMTGAMTLFGAGDFRYDMPPIGANADVEIIGNDDEQTFRIEPIERPRISNLMLMTQHPTELAPTGHDFASQESDFSFLPKTKMELKFVSNVAIGEAKIKSNVDSPSMASLKRLDDRTFSMSWEHAAPVQLQIELVGKGSKLESLPTPVAVGLKVDLPPRVSLTYTSVRTRITPMAKIPLQIQARDDMGIARLDLNTKSEILMADAPASSTSAATQPTTMAAIPSATQASSQPANKPGVETLTQILAGPMKPAADMELQKAFTLEVPTLKLPAGSILSVYAAASDDCYTGAQTSASRVVTFRIVPAEELFREILLRLQGERAKYRKLIEEAQKLQGALPAVATPEAAANIARQHRTIARENIRIANSFNESVTEMKFNMLGGAEAWDLMDKNILVPFKKLNDELMIQQRDALDALTGEDTAKVNDAIARQEKIVAKMQELLKQMSQWDSFVDVLNQLNAIIDLENKVKKSTEVMKKKQTDGVFDP